MDIEKAASWFLPAGKMRHHEKYWRYMQGNGCELNLYWTDYGTFERRNWHGCHEYLYWFRERHMPWLADRLAFIGAAYGRPAMMSHTRRPDDADYMQHLKTRLPANEALKGSGAVVYRTMYSLMDGPTLMEKRWVAPGCTYMWYSVVTTQKGPVSLNWVESKYPYSWDTLIDGWPVERIRAAAML